MKFNPQTNTYRPKHLAIATLVLLCLAVCEHGYAEPTSRELFALRGVDDATWAHFTDGVALVGEEAEPLCHVLIATRSFRLRDVERWADRPWMPAPATGADAHRGEFFLLTGRLRSAERIPVTADAPARAELPAYYRCEIELEGNGTAGAPGGAIVYATAIPGAWSAADELDEAVSVRAVLLKTQEAEQGGIVPVFAARRMAWHPDTPLGKLGMDVGLLDTAVDNRSLVAADRECFYQLLAAVDDDVAVAPTDTPTPAVALFNQADEIRGDRVWLRGWTRRITRIEVDEADIAARFGIGHYYQMEMFSDDSQHNAIVCCLRELPEGMPTGGKIQEDVSVTGFMMKKWAYRGEAAASEKTRGDGQVIRLAPLVIARTLDWHPRAAANRDPTSGIVAACVFSVVFFFIITAVWRTGKRDQAVRRGR
jgi:hypothetical protein